MDEETSSTAPSPITSALASGATSPAQTGAVVNPKSTGLLEEAVPMVIVQQFIEDNKEKGDASEPTSSRPKEEAGGDQS